MHLLQRRFDLGDISELDLARAKTEEANARTQAIGLERRRGELEHALAVFVGKPPEALEIEVAPIANELPAIPPGLPSELLERRPDIAAATRQMAAANSRIGVAKAAFFPVLKLTAAGGYESADLADLFNWSSRTWLLGPLIGTILSAPIIDGGRNRANLERAEAGLQESVAVYRQQVLVAFAEVEDNLIALRTLDGQAQSTRDVVTSAARAQRIAQVRYKAGATAISMSSRRSARCSLCSGSRCRSAVRARTRPSRSSAPWAADGMRPPRCQIAGRPSSNRLDPATVPGCRGMACGRCCTWLPVVL